MVRRRRRGAVVGDGHTRRIADVAVNVGHGVFDRFRVTSEARSRSEGDFAGGGVDCPGAFAGNGQGGHRTVIRIQQFDAALVEGMVALRVAVVRKHVHFNRLACRAFARVVVCNRFNVGWRRGGTVVGDGHARRIADVAVNVGHGVFDRFRVTSEARSRSEGDFAGGGVDCPGAFAGNGQGGHRTVICIQQFDAALVEGVVALWVAVVCQHVHFNWLACCCRYCIVSSHWFDCSGWEYTIVINGDGSRLTDVSINVSDGVFNWGWITGKACLRSKSNFAGRSINFPLTFACNCQ